MKNLIYVSINEIKIGDVFKSYSRNGEEITHYTDTVAEINLEERYVLTERGTKSYGYYAGNGYYGLVK